ncbi:beta-N-acetylhexosaminidase [Saccharibacillus sacchari]|uniref:Beta-N-acetylhexosaminidase n=1 Tax=Saccharibacillus sacchari TaxID=456493 RepID=A0ACC6PDE4_9BACL
MTEQQAEATAEAGKWIELLLGSLDLRGKLGQMLLGGFDGRTMNAAAMQLIAAYRTGGIIYFSRNVSSPEQVAALTRELQEAAEANGVPPLWISIDQEGGMVARITEGVTLMPGQMAIAAAGSTEDAYRCAYISGRELRSLGINLNYAPVLDVNNNPANPVIGVRSFGESPEIAAAFGAATIGGLQDAGVGATAKHFPGHGDTDVDSHLDLPTVPHDRARMDRVELVPFKQAVKQGVDAVMSAHIYFPALEEAKLPVTLSPAVLTGLLREELGFDGIITTDCMEMNAIAEHYGVAEASVLAVLAGADQVLVSHRLDRQGAALNALENAVQSGRIAESRIDDSVRRLLRMKWKRGLLTPETARKLLGEAAEARGVKGGAEKADAESGGKSGLAASEEMVPEDLYGSKAFVRRKQAEQAARREGQSDRAGAEAGEISPGKGGSDGLFAGLRAPESLETARRVSENSVTLVRNERAVLPLRAARTLVVTCSANVTAFVDESIAGTRGLGYELAELGLDVIDVIVGADGVEAEQERLLIEARRSDTEQIVVGTYNARFNPAQAVLVRRLTELGKPLAVVALRDPYDLLEFPDVPAYVAVYESRPLALRSAATALLGRIPFRGRLPVSLGERYPVGWGIRP